MRILCAFGQHNYGDVKRGESYEYTNFIPALRNLGHEIVFFDVWNKSAFNDYSELNRSFLEIVERERPDVIFCVLLGYEIWSETFELIRHLSPAALIHWSTDDSWKYEQSSRLIAASFDLMVTTYPSAIEKANKDGYSNFVLSQWAADSSRMQAPLPATHCRYQVSFVGSTYGNREQWVADLAQRGIHVDTFGYGWPNGPVAAEAIAGIIRESVVSLNFGDSGVVIKNGKLVRSRQIKARVFEVPGAGGLLLTQCAEGLGNFYAIGKEVAVFDNLDELVQKIQYLLSHSDERDAIAKAGYERTGQDHTYESRFAPVLDLAIRKRNLRVADVDSVGFDSFEVMARSYRPHFLLLLLRVVLLFPCFLIWGKKRGPRAARRLLFELSWRIMGRKTYSVKGWPGRIFYHES